MKSIVILALLLSACTRPEDAIRVLKYEDMENIEITGYNFFSCYKGEAFHTGFKAEKHGEIIRGTVCSGFFKNSTIRYE